MRSWIIRTIVTPGVKILIAGALGSCAFSCVPSHFPATRPFHRTAYNVDAAARAHEYFITALDFDRRDMPDVATRYYEMASALDPQSVVLRESLAEHLLAQGKFREALYTLKGNRPLSKLTDNEKRLLANSYLKMRQLRSAAETLEAIGRPESEELYSIGLLYEALGNNQKAIQYYRRYLDKSAQPLRSGLKSSACRLKAACCRRPKASRCTWGPSLAKSRNS